jgi:signal transduction histidine kinase
MSDPIANQVLLDGLGHAVLLFSHDNRLVQANVAAATLLGADLNIIRSDGWLAVAQLFENNPREVLSLHDIRKDAITSQRPVRFYVYRSGEYLPCWASALVGHDGNIYTMLTMDTADWGAINDVLAQFRAQMQDTVTSTLGHVNLINRLLAGKNDDEATIKLAKRIGGFTKLIGIHMYRAERLNALTERLEDARTGRLRAVAHEKRQRIKLEDFLEDFMESLDSEGFLDPETEKHDHRARVTVVVERNLAVAAVKRYLSFTLQELVRNAIMYSLRGTPIRITASQKGAMAQIDIADEGYGIPEQDQERVFQPFLRGRKPQVMSEFGYGLCLYLCKHEIAAMNGKLWFTTNENVGTTFSLQLPLWQESSSS